MINIFDPVFISAIIVGVAILMYAILDGFDLGVGILFPWAPSDKDRGIMINSIIPVWDGNETWMILGIGGIIAVFPGVTTAYFPAFYIPIMVMLISLIFRGLAFEFRMKAKNTRPLWDISFTIGSTLMAFCQGLILGSVLNGIPITEDFMFTGNSFTFLNEFSIITGFATVMAYALLGACWIILKSQDNTQLWARNIAKPLFVIFVGFIIMISLMTPLKYEFIADRWFSFPNILFLSPIPLLTTFLLFKLWQGIIDEKKHAQAFISTILIFVLCAVGLAISILPYAILPNITIWDVATHPNSLKIIMILMAIMLPMILAYTVIVYRIFKGKITTTESLY